MRIFSRIEPANKIVACKTGLDQADGRVVVFTDDDLRPIPSWLEAHISRHAKEQATVSVTGLVQYPEEWEQASNWVRFANENYRQNFKLARSTGGILPPNRFAGGNTSVKKEVLRDLKLWDEKMRRGEDLFWGCRLHEMGIPLLFESNALAYHHAESAKSIELTLKSFRLFYEIDRPKIRKIYPWYFEKYGHWFLEPVRQDDSEYRKITKRMVLATAMRGTEQAVLQVLKLVDSLPNLYFRPFYQFVMACEALDAIKATENRAS